MAISLWAQPLAKDDCQLKWIRSLGLCFISRETRSVWEWRLWYQIFSFIFWYVLNCSDILYTIYTHYICYIYIYTMISLDMFSIYGFWVLVGWTGGTSLARSDHIIGEVLTRTWQPHVSMVAQSNLKTSSFQTPPPQPIHNPLIFESTSCKLDVLDTEFSYYFVRCLCMVFLIEALRMDMYWIVIQCTYQPSGHLGWDVT